MYLNPRAGWGPPGYTTECFLQGPRVWGWLRLGLLRRLCLWLLRVSGGFVCSFRWFAFGVGFARPEWRWFRFIFAVVWRLVLVDPG